jgi:hypothetical protein
LQIVIEALLETVQRDEIVQSRIHGSGKGQGPHLMTLFYPLKI